MSSLKRKSNDISSLFPVTVDVGVRPYDSEYRILISVALEIRQAWYPAYASLWKLVYGDN